MKKLRNWIATFCCTKTVTGPFGYFQLAYLSHTLTTLLTRCRVPRARSLQRRCTHWLDREIVIKNSAGFFSVNPKNDSLTKSISSFEYKQHAWVEVPASKHIFLDIGASIGFYSLLASQVGYRRVYAFEPNPASYKRLSDNLALNNLDQVIATQVGLGDKTGEAALAVREDHTGASSFVNRNLDKWPEVVVPVTTLDSFVSEHAINPGDISFIKIDVEDYEHAVLTGMTQTLAALPIGACLCIEIHPRAAHSAQTHNAIIDSGFTLIDQTSENNFLYQKS